jgi:hypothetical protein
MKYGASVALVWSASGAVVRDRGRGLPFLVWRGAAENYDVTGDDKHGQRSHTLRRRSASSAGQCLRPNEGVRCASATPADCLFLNRVRPPIAW